MSEIIKILIPLNKTYLNTFLNSFIQIYFFNDNSFTLESLKNLLFPPEHLDKDFNELVNFIKIICDDLIKYNKDINQINKDLHKRYSFDGDILQTISLVIAQKRNEILNFLNSKFDFNVSDNKFLFNNLNWSIKSILSANKEHYYNERYSDLEFTYAKVFIIYNNRVLVLKIYQMSLFTRI